MTSRSEEILTAIAEGTPTEIEPQCRKEMFLKAIANGDASNLPDPTCREEVLLKQIAENGTSENLDVELNEQDTLLQELESSVNELPTKPYDRLQWKCDHIKSLYNEFGFANASVDFEQNDTTVTQCMQGIDTGNVLTMQNMFNSGGVSGEIYRDLSGITLNMSNCNNAIGMFSGQSKLTKLPKLINASKLYAVNTMFQNCIKLSEIPLFDTSGVDNMNSTFAGCKGITTIPLFNTSNVTIMMNTFKDCINLTTIPLLNTSKVKYMDSMFEGCKALVSLPLLDTSSLTNADNMVRNCTSLTILPEWDFSKVTTLKTFAQNCSNITEVKLNTPNVTSFYWAFINMDNLETLELDLIKATSVANIVNNDTKLTNLKLKNIKISLGIGSGTSWGHLLTLDSLLNTIKELHTNTGTKTLTLTMGTANTAKLADVYVKLIDITDEMRTEDEYIDNKAPFIQCESTDEGAMLITDYVTIIKKWDIA